jgi:hypothetical protein
MAQLMSKGKKPFGLKSEPLLQRRHSLFENGSHCAGSRSQGMTAFSDNHGRALQPAVDSNL